MFYPLRKASEVRNLSSVRFRPQIEGFNKRTPVGQVTSGSRSNTPSTCCAKCANGSAKCAKCAKCANGSATLSMLCQWNLTDVDGGESCQRVSIVAPGAR